MKISVSCLLIVNRHFGEACWLHLQNRKIRKSRNQCESGGPACHLLHDGFPAYQIIHISFFLGLFFNPKDAGKIKNKQTLWLL
jgi:hypothetical protein